MGTRGYRVIRFRGRYYRFFNRFDSYPEIFGDKIVSEIPTGPKAYQKWLAERRKEAMSWHLAVERYLCRKLADYEGNEDFNKDASESDNSEIARKNKKPWGVATDGLPDFTPALNDLFNQWVYTIDLDNEVFTIDNGAHFRLDWIPRGSWIEALAHAHHGDRVLLPDAGSEDAIADLVVKLPSPTLDMLNNLDIIVVKAKGLDAFPPTQRHGPLFRARIFHLLQDTYEPILSAILLNWRTDELLFREIAYALLCVASGSPNLSFVPVEQLSPKIGYTDLKNTNGRREKAEFFAHLGVGYHLEGLPPGSSPDSGMYWLNGALVCLAGQRENCPKVLDGALVRVVEYCRSQRPNQCVNAILMTIQNIVLMRIYPGGRVERTEALPLFDIPTHTSMNASGRYEVDDLEKMYVRKEKAIERRGEEDSEEEDTIDDLTCCPGELSLRLTIEDETEVAFLALTNFLEVSSRQQMPPSRPKEGVFPTEIYRMILLHLEDLQTHHACMQVSRSFRDLCQQNNRMTMDRALAQTITTSPTGAWVPVSRIQNLSTGQSRDTGLRRRPLRMSMYGMKIIRRPEPLKSCYQVLVGSERNRRSILPQLVVGFDTTRER